MSRRRSAERPPLLQVQVPAELQERLEAHAKATCAGSVAALVRRYLVNGLQGDGAWPAHEDHRKRT